MTDQDDLHYVGVCRLQAAYADAVTRRAWSDLDALFLAGARVQVDTVTSAPIEVVGAAGIGSFIAKAIDRFEFFELVILNVHVMKVPVDTHPDAHPDQLRSRSFTCELRQESGSGHWTNAFGVYHDELQRVEGRWMYAARRYQSLARTGRSEVFPFPAVAGFE